MAAQEDQVRKAVRHFWTTRSGQSERQGGQKGARDQGERSAVTGGKHMDGFVDLVFSHLIKEGIPKQALYCNSHLELPGYFRAEKKWDLVVVYQEQLIAAIEFKAHIGPSFGNNFNNRTEEALGNATDLWTAYREGAFQLSSRPWLGYLMLLEEAPTSIAPVQPKEPHFPVFPEFKDASYRERYVQLLSRLLRERLYDGACLLASKRSEGKRGLFSQPCADLGVDVFLRLLSARVYACLGTH